MKRIMLVILLNSSSFLLLAQNIKPSNTLIGQDMPNFKIGRFINNVGNVSNALDGRVSFAEFKGKLVILDFWDIYCTSCISGFKKMSALQEKYGDKIQIFLVNLVQDEIKIVEWLNKQNQRLYPNKIVPTNLPIITNSPELEKLFPIRGEIGYNVWIGPDGKIKLRGISENTNEEKIDQLLSGSAISYVEDNALTYKARYPYFRFSEESSSLRFSSSFGLFDDKMASAYGVEVNNFMDSVNYSRRNTYVNFEVFKLLKIATTYKFSRDTSFLFGERILTNIKDLSVITLDERKLKRDVRDDDFRNKVSYEQIIPINLPDSIAKEMMLFDLKRYLKNCLGIILKWEVREIPCYKIEKLDEPYSRTIGSNKMEFSYEYNGDLMYYKYAGYRPSALFRHYFDMFKIYSSVYMDDIIVDGLSSNSSIDLMLPDPFDVKSLESFNAYIRQYGFILRPSTIKLKMLVVSK